MHIAKRQGQITPKISANSLEYIKKMKFQHYPQIYGGANLNLP